MTSNCSNYTEEERQELLTFFKRIFDGKEITLNGKKYFIKELVDVVIEEKKDE